jgi:hypothetical protein
MNTYDNPTTSGLGYMCFVTIPLVRQKNGHVS